MLCITLCFKRKKDFLELFTVAIFVFLFCWVIRWNFLGKNQYSSTQSPPYKSKAYKSKEGVGKKRLVQIQSHLRILLVFECSVISNVCDKRQLSNSYPVAVILARVMLLGVINVSKILNFLIVIFFFRKGMFVNMCSEHAAVWWPFSPRNSWDVCWTFLFSERLQWCIPNIVGWF